MELKASEIALLSLVKNKSKIHVYLKMDKTTAVSYMNKMGRGGRSLNLTKTAKNIWEFSLGMEITLTSDHLPGLLNQTADWESRKVKDTSSNNCKLTIKYSVRSTNNWVQLIWICLQRD